MMHLCVRACRKTFRMMLSKMAPRRPRGRAFNARRTRFDGSWQSLSSVS